MRALDYAALRAAVKARLAAQRTLTLATSWQDDVTARTVYCCSQGLTAYILTSRAYDKYRQLQKNPRAALCFDNVQLKGAARLLGHPAQAENEALLRACPQFCDAFWHWSRYKNAALLAIDVTEAELWQDGGREYLHVNEQRAYRVG